MLESVDKRIAAVVVKKAGKKLDQVISQAQDLVLIEGKTPARALADALELYNLN